MPETYSLNKITMKYSTLHLIMALIMAMVFAGLVSFVDVILRIDFLQIEDRVNYLTLAENSSLWFTDILSQPLIYIIIDKPLFKVVFFLLNSIGLTPIDAIRAVIFFSTAVTFFVMLLLYQTHIIDVTKRVRSVIITVTTSIMVVYLTSLILSFFDIRTFIWGTSWWAIGFNILAAIVASFALLLDFDYIERYKNKAPKQKDWLATWGLLATLIWLYVEALRLLQKFAIKFR